MAIKIIIGRGDKKSRKCLFCGSKIEKALKDDEVYTCERCGQRHLVDIYPDCIHITVAERPEIRHRNVDTTTEEQRQARRDLIARVEAKRKAEKEWVEKYKDWLEELAAMSKKQLKIELAMTDEELLKRVQKYLEKRNNE